MKVENTVSLSNSKAVSTIFPLVPLVCLMVSGGIFGEENIVVLEKPKTAFGPKELDWIHMAENPVATSEDELN